MKTTIGHLAFTCADVEKSVAFYCDVLGMKVKFRLTYGDILDNEQKKAEERGEAVSPETVSRLKPVYDKVWITYCEMDGGQFVELFDAGGATEYQLPTGKTYNYNHVALVVEDIHAAYEELKAKGAPIDTPPTMGMEHTWQMWSHDPDGNRVEFMQYTDKSWQLTGR